MRQAEATPEPGLCTNHCLVLDGVTPETVKLMGDICSDAADDEALFHTLRSWKRMLDEHNANARKAHHEAQLMKTDEFIDTLGGDVLRVLTFLARCIGSAPQYVRPSNAGRRFLPLDRTWWQMCFGLILRHPMRGASR